MRERQKERKRERASEREREKEYLDVVHQDIQIQHDSYFLFLVILGFRSLLIYIVDRTQHKEGIFVESSWTSQRYNSGALSGPRLHGGLVDPMKP